MLVANQNQLNLGRIPHGSPRKFKFSLKNTDSISTTINSISVGCGSCTQASTDKSVIEAGGTTDINVVFTPNSIGIQLKSVTLHTDKGQIKLTFSAEVY